ncbi:adenosine deaminase [Arthrobacter sp. efr-133-R2A-120]|uniref:adenosine deaminase n=1 Tax=Arthrobacter sp. efr-133-R2A-120 TaxID=3040277 RepID=UPI00254AE943|nr:adenosine deaminase [Arthrobacter sp. efr-133-R2A-120]
MTSSATRVGGASLSFGLPFCELHVHLEGTLEPEMIFSLATRNEFEMPYSGISDLRRRYEFADLQSFLDLYYDNMTVLQTERDFFDLALGFLARAHEGGVRHVEMFLDPQAHSARGIPVERVLAGAHKAKLEAQREFGITAEIIVCVLRDQPVRSAHEMLESVLLSGVPVAGIGLDSAEIGYPPRLFRDVFSAARDAGLRCVAHAGEEGPPDYIWQALDVLGAERIDHGVRCLEDVSLVARLAADQIPLTVCPMSNERLRVVDSVADIPLRQMLEHGLLVTLNSDDPAYFGGYLEDNLQACIAAFGFNRRDLNVFAGNSIKASFASNERKAQLLEELD